MTLKYHSTHFHMAMGKTHKQRKTNEKIFKYTCILILCQIIFYHYRNRFSTLIPLLIAPRNEQLTIGGRISFNDQVWDIEDGDIFSISGIGYYYLSRGMNSRDEEDWEPEEPIPTNQYYIGSEITIPTENGYFTTNQKFKLKKRAMSFVTILPLEVGKLEVITLKQGEPITNTFIIKENV